MIETWQTNDSLSRRRNPFLPLFVPPRTSSPNEKHTLAGTDRGWHGQNQNKSGKEESIGIVAARSGSIDKRTAALPRYHSRVPLYEKHGNYLLTVSCYFNTHRIKVMEKCWS